MDDDDQRWVDRQRRKYLSNGPDGAKMDRNKKKMECGGNPRPLPTSDAVLNCPACMTLLCLDCQRYLQAVSLDFPWAYVFFYLWIVRIFFVIPLLDDILRCGCPSTPLLIGNITCTKNSDSEVIFRRHDIYRHQYRAMFVQNCTAQADEILRYPSVAAATRGNRNKKQKKSVGVKAEEEHVPERTATVGSTGDANPLPNDGETGDDIYHPVKCDVCNTEVGVYDRDEVYHFFNVLASYA